jgi:hypothetical protein
MRFAPRSLLLCALLLACTVPLAAQTSFRARVGLLGYRDPIAIDTIAIETKLAAPPGKVFLGAVDGFKGLNIPLEVRDSVGGLVGVTAYKKSRAMAGSQMSKWFNCGAGMTGPNADNYRLDIAFMVIVDKDGATGTRLRVGAIGSGVDVAGNAKDPVACASSGLLEAKLLDVVKAYIARNP